MGTGAGGRRDVYSCSVYKRERLELNLNNNILISFPGLLPRLYPIYPPWAAGRRYPCNTRTPACSLIVGVFRILHGAPVFVLSDFFPKNVCRVDVEGPGEGGGDRFSSETPRSKSCSDL